jgi:hypothetical protein
MSDTGNQTTPASTSEEPKTGGDCCTVPGGGDPGPGGPTG